VLGEETNLADQSYQYLTTGDDMRGFHDDTAGHAKVSLSCRSVFSFGRPDYAERSALCDSVSVRSSR
jgi:hypothetical protein